MLPGDSGAYAKSLERAVRRFGIFIPILLFAVIGAVEWLTMARIIRGQVLAIRPGPGQQRREQQKQLRAAASRCYEQASNAAVQACLKEVEARGAAVQP